MREQRYQVLHNEMRRAMRAQTSEVSLFRRHVPFFSAISLILPF